MRLPQAYRSLPRSYSVYKPSYPLISLIEIKEMQKFFIFDVYIEHALQLQISSFFHPVLR